MKVIVHCEESQAITIAFRNKGHEAYSNDIQDCSGAHPEWHIKCDARDLINEYADLRIFHPDCTYITNSGVCWLHTEYGRWEKLKLACEFFNLRHKFNSPRIATENPIPHKYAVEKIGRYNQLIQPWQFGHLETKATCLWLHNLPLLQPTNIVKKQMLELPKNVSNRLHYLPPSSERAKLRSKTYAGIAEAMANQWSEFLF